MAEPNNAAAESPGDGPSPAYHLANVALVAFVLLVFSLALYDQVSNGWKGPKYQISAEQVRIGLPVTWLYVTSLKVEGNPPPMSVLPEGNLYRAPLAVNEGGFIASVVCLFAVAAALCPLARRLRRSRHFSFARGPGLRYGLLAAAWTGFGALVPGPPGWGFALILVTLFALTVGLTWADRSIGALTAGGALAAPCLAWGSNMANLLRTTDREYIPGLGESLMQMAILLAAAVVLTLALAGAARLAVWFIGKRARRAPAAPPEEGS